MRAYYGVTYQTSPHPEETLGFFAPVLPGRENLMTQIAYIIAQGRAPWSSTVHPSRSMATTGSFLELPFLR